MTSPRWMKLHLDLRQNRGRTVLIVAALAAGVFGLTTMLTAWSILGREIRRNYRDTHPASAALLLDRADRALAEQVRKLDGIDDAEARGTVSARVQAGADWRLFLLFVVDDFADLRLGRFTSETGAWPPPAGSILLERTTGTLLSSRVGATLVLKTRSGQPREVAVAGLVHDAGLVPSGQERRGYGYATVDTLRLLGERPELNELRILVAGTDPDHATIEATARRVAAWLEANGRIVHEIRVPPPGRHPHQSQMEGILALFIAFSLMALVLSAILVAVVIAGMLAGQIREIAIMKAIGGRRNQIAGLYLALVAALGATAVALGLPAGFAAGVLFSERIAKVLNFTITSSSVPAWVLLAPGIAGLFAPLAFAALPIRKAARMTVREAIADSGVASLEFGRRPFERWLAAWRGAGPLPSLALRNLFRRPGRLALALGLLAAAGGMFLTSLNVREAWRRMVGRVYTERRYDIEVRLNRPAPAEDLHAALDCLPGVRALETWGWAPAAVARPGEADITQTYPDGGHGSFALLGVPPPSVMVDFPLLAGRWLRPGDTGAVVLNQGARALFPGVQVGDRVSLSIEGRSVAWTVVGVVEEVGSPAAAYVAAGDFADTVGADTGTTLLRIASTAGDPGERSQAIRGIEAALQGRGIGVNQSLPLAELKTAMGEHIGVLVATLGATAALLGTIGLLGLASTLGMSVLERTREIGAMKAIGARPRTIVALVIWEGLLIGVASWVAALPIAAVLSWLVGQIVGLMTFKIPLPVAMAPMAIGLWLLLVLALATAASAYPARRAGRLTVREALAYA